MRRTVVISATALAAVGLLAGCGSGSGSANTAASNPTTASTTSTASASPTPSSSAAVTVGQSPIESSTLASGAPPIFSTGQNVTQDKYGTVLAVPADKTTVAVNSDSHGVPQSFEVGVDVTPPSSSNLLYGIGCQGDWYDFGEQYAAVTSSAGDWQIVEQTQKAVTVLAKGTASVSSGDTQLNLVCAQVPGQESDVRMSFAIDGHIVDTIDHTDKNMPVSNGFTVLLVDPNTGTAGSARFHTFTLYSAQAT